MCVTAFRDAMNCRLYTKGTQINSLERFIDDFLSMISPRVLPWALINRPIVAVNTT